MFSNEEMDFEIEKDTKAQPTFSEMVGKAIEILKKDEDGFFLVAESGLIGKSVIYIITLNINYYLCSRYRL